MRHTPLTRDTAAYMRTPPPLYDHLFKGKKMAGMAGEIRQLWLAPRSPHESPLERATQELQVCRKLRAYHELILNREAARLTSFTRGMQLRVAIRTTSNFVAAAWATISNIRTGPRRGPDAPLAYIRSSTDPNTLIPYGPLYEQEVVKQVGEKWGHKHISNVAVEYVLDLIDYGARSLPKATDPAAWIATEYTLSNFRRQLRRVRPNLAQGFEGPHLYPLAQMGDRVIRASLGDLRQAVRARQSHVSFNTRRLLFIHKKGRDRFDFIKGCRPIRCLSHLQSLDEGMCSR